MPNGYDTPQSFLISPVQNSPVISELLKESATLTSRHSAPRSAHTIVCSKFRVAWNQLYGSGQNYPKYQHWRHLVTPSCDNFLAVLVSTKIHIFSWNNKIQIRKISIKLWQFFSYTNVHHMVFRNVIRSVLLNFLRKIPKFVDTRWAIYWANVFQIQIYSLNRCK